MDNFCIDCKIKISNHGIRCKKCSIKARRKHFGFFCVDCGKEISKYPAKRCIYCAYKNEETNYKKGIAKLGDNNPAKRIDVRNKIRETLKRKYKTGEITSPFKKGHKINKGRIHNKEYRENRMGEKNPFFGRHHTLEAKKKYKEKRKNWVSPKKDTTIEIKIQNFLKELGIEHLTHFWVSEIEHRYQCDIFMMDLNKFKNKLYGREDI